MDFNKLYQFSQEGLFTDLTLILTDESHTDIRINVHKIFLCAMSEYFEKLLTTCREKNMNSIPLSIPGIHTLTMHSVIASFYQQKIDVSVFPKWLYKLESIICRDFWGLPETKSLSKLISLDIPTEGFELLLRAASISSSSACRLVLKNLPDNFDLEQIPTKISNILQHIDSKLAVIVGCSSRTVIIKNVITNKLIRVFESSSYLIGMCYSPINSSLACLNNRCDLLIFNISNGLLIKKISTQHIESVLLFINYSPDGKYLAIAHDMYDGGPYTRMCSVRTIQIIDTTSYVTVRIIRLKEKFNMVFSSDHQTWLVITYDHHSNNQKLRSIDYKDSEKDMTIDTYTSFNGICNMNDNFCSHRSMGLYAYGSRNLIIGDSKSETILDQLCTGEHFIRCICFSPNGKQIAFVRTNIYIIDLDTKNKKKIEPLIEINSITAICYTPDSMQIAVTDKYYFSYFYHVDNGQLIHGCNYAPNSTGALLLVHLDGDAI